jgi:acetyl-CoA carboxylase biotin carboxylase subunit
MSVPKRKQVRPLGHAIEFRINAEDPQTFAPSPGRITRLILPGGPGVRVDTHIYAGYTVPPYYDSLVAKLLVHGRSREEAIVRGKRALSMLQVDGIKTSASLHQRILEDGDFLAGRVDTHFMERFLA